MPASFRLFWLAVGGVSLFGAPAVSTSKSSYLVLEPILVSYSGLPGTNDWIAVTNAAQPDTNYGQWFYTNRAVSGTMTFDSLEPGTYQARVYLNYPSGGYTVVARTTFTVVYPVPSVSTNKVNYLVLEKITAAYSNMPGYAKDYITLVPAGTPEDTYGVFQFTGGAKSGSMLFDSLPPGNWEARAHFNNQNGPVRARYSFTVSYPTPSVSTDKTYYSVNDKITVGYSNMPGYPKDYITLVPTGTPDNTYGVFQFTGGATGGSMLFNPVSAGQWEARALFNNENGPVRARSGFWVGTTPAPQRVRDFRGIGRSDVLIYDAAGGNAYAGLSAGNGTFDYVYTPFSTNLTALRTGDFDGNGKSDLVLYNAGNALGYIGTGAGNGTFNFQSLFWGPGFDHITAADLNNDARTDFLLYRSSDGTSYTALSNGAGGFTYRYALVSVGFTHVTAGDVNGDGRADVVFYRSSDGLSYLGLSSGDGAFTFSGLTPGGGFDVVHSGDLNGDGRMDLLLYMSSNGATRTATSTGTGFTYATQSYSAGFTAARLVDLNGDAKADVVFYNKNNAIGYYGIGAGNGTFTFGSIFWGYGMDWVEPQDLNGDGKGDIVLYNSSTGTAYAAISNGLGGFAYTYSYWGIGRVLAR